MADAIPTNSEKPQPTLPYIHSLSNDLLLEIFNMYISEQLETYCHTLPQYILTTVCKGWRNLVLDAPLLWTKIKLPLASPYNLATYFERSEPALIDVWYDTHSQWMNEEGGQLPQILDMISSHISRIRSLIIKSWELKEVFPILCSWKGQDATELQILSVFVTYVYPDDDPSTGVPGLFGDLMNIRTLDLEKFPLQHLLPLPLLTFLKVDRLSASADDFQSLLDSCPALETLVIRRFGAAISLGQDHHRKIVAPTLRFLAIHIGSDHDDYCGCFLPFFSTPNLEYLEVVYLQGYMTNHHRSIFSQWTKSPNLQALHIHSDRIWHGDLSFLSSLPEITDLHIHECLVPLLSVPLSYIINFTNPRSVTLNLSPESFHDFFDSLPTHLPNLRFPFFIRSPVTDDLSVFKAQLQEHLGVMADVILPSKDKAFLHEDLQTQHFLRGLEEEDDFTEGFSDDSFEADHYDNVDFYPDSEEIYYSDEEYLDADFD